MEAVSPLVSLMVAGGAAAAVGTWLERWAAAHPPAPAPAPPAPSARPAPGCAHGRVVDCPDTSGTVVARLCLDCDKQLPVRTPAWP